MRTSNTKEKAQITKNINAIFSMSAEEVMAFQQKISLSTARPQVKQWLYEACDSRLARLNGRAELMAVNGDMGDFN